MYPRTNSLLLAGMSVLIEAAYPLSPNCFIPTKIHDSKRQNATDTTGAGLNWDVEQLWSRLI